MAIQPTDKLCCFPLESGVKYWGWTSVVFSTLSAIGSVVMLCTYERSNKNDATTNSLLELNVMFSVMIAVALLGIGTSYMVVMAVNQV